MIGDTAAWPDRQGGFLPGLAPVAKHPGRQAARAIPRGGIRPLCSLRDHLPSEARDASVGLRGDDVETAQHGLHAPTGAFSDR